MKKAKIFLTAVTLFAVVGGALAFKAQRGFTQFFYTTQEGGACNIPVQLQSTLDQNGPVVLVAPYTTEAGEGSNCIATSLYAAE